MANLFWTLISYLCKALISLRYKVEIKGQDLLDSKNLDRAKGILFLPNHSAHIDPLMLFIWFWPKFRMRPLVIEYVYRLPMMKPLIHLVKAIAIPNFDTSINEFKIKKAEAAIQQIAAGLKQGENFILYPAGRLKNTGKEIIGGSSGAHALVQECPNANIVLIRTSGLWGSTFSRAFLGRSPELPPTTWHGIKTIFKNFIFFCPRRKVYIEIEPNPPSLPRRGSRLEFNRFLENWYNRYPDDAGRIHESEPLKLVSYSFWKKDVPKVFERKKRKGTEGTLSISPEIQEKIYAEIRRILNSPSLEVTPEMSLSFDLAMDSLNIGEMIAFLSHSYDVGEVHPEELETVQSLLEIAAGESLAAPSDHITPQFSWPSEKNRPQPVLPLGRTLAEAFLNSCARMDSFSACGDDVIGVLNYRKLKKVALVLGAHFKNLPGEYVGVLLPASAGAFIVILALQFAGKIPVMLNWTLGPRYLDEMMKLTGAQTVISSWRFLERVNRVEFGTLLDKIQLLEDMRREIKFTTKLRGAFLSLCSPSFVLRAMHLENVDENAPCVILFTSGTEAAPKGVPLSHKNIISNERAAMQCIDLNYDDVLYGILPPFHSFGFSVAGIFSLLSGLKIAFYPDPTDSFALAEGIERWKVTLFCSAPSFLKGLFAAAKKEQLRSVRFFVSGAEKASPELFERVEKLGTGAKLIEGYGITECAPILTINRMNLPSHGVGRILPEIEMCTIHPETLQLLPEGSEGEICVRGPNVFNGYLGNPRSPFIEIQGKRWYRTGDLGHLEKDGSLVLSGRLKRFTKLGGEMISLGAIEEVLATELARRGKIPTDLPTIAVLADERIEGKPQLVVFSTIPLDKETANEIISHTGFSRLVKISQVKKIEEIPLLGTGKTDYRRLQTLIE
ncbi:MAG: AMP-binding protein [Chlamydiota bacterium]